jgi:NAD(P)-dependent dehydrogenase (short-subunit alcohol dehydrogenase family)
VNGPGRLAGRTAIVFGGGQTPGRTVGNGRASALTYAREGARVVVVDLHIDRAEATTERIRADGGEALALAADVTREDDVRSAVEATLTAFGSIDILHNNVGVSIAGGDAVATEITLEAFDHIVALNLRSMVLAAKHTLPVMRDQGRGVVTNISSIAAVTEYPYVAYQTTKAGVLGLTRNLATAEAEHGIRVNAILPGLLDTPMAIESRVGLGIPREEVIASRSAKVPLGGSMGDAWDVANAALFLASDEARFITGVCLPVDGGQRLKNG